MNFWCGSFRDFRDMKNEARNDGNVIHCDIISKTILNNTEFSLVLKGTDSLRN